MSEARKGKEFTKATKVKAHTRANGNCEGCGAKLGVGKFQYDHIIPIAQGGDNSLGNCEVLCNVCHDAKTHKKDIPEAAKSKRRQAKHVGAKKSRTPLPAGRTSDVKKTMDGKLAPRTKPAGKAALPPRPLYK
jgi:5-methylcytosine-specific restriction protein A